MPEEQARLPVSGGHKEKRTGSQARLVVALILGLGAAGGFLGWDWLRPTNVAERPMEVSFPLETFVINLEDSGPRAFLRIGITLGLAHPVTSRGGEQPPVALVRDTILGVLASCQREQLLKAEGKRQLKDQLLKALQERVPQMSVESVYFTEFLVQM